MNTKPLPAVMVGLMLASGLLATTPTASGTTCKAGPASSPKCAFVCSGGDVGLSVGISSQDGGFVQAGANCPGEGPNARCEGMGECHASAEATGAPGGAADCAGWADDGDGVVTCNGGDTPADAMLHLLGHGGCDDLAFSLLGYTSLAVVYISADPAAQHKSFSWNIDGGCVSTPSLCEKAGGRLACHINQEFKLYTDV